MMLEFATVLLTIAAIVGVYEVLEWRRQARAWRRSAEAAAFLAETLIQQLAPNDDSLLEARAELAKIRKGVAT
jgi:hypothetical protein